MSLSHKIVKDHYLTNRNFCSDDYDKTIRSLQQLLPGSNIIRYAEPQVLKGWQIPPKWNLLEASIQDVNGLELLDAAQHPLQVIGLSAPVDTTVTGEELKQHLHYKTYFDGVSAAAIPFHFRQFYQPWKRTWGFCVNQAFYDSIDDQVTYHVTIKTDEKEGYLELMEYDLPGESDQTIIFVAHLDHPGMANDDLSGCAVGIELFTKLRELPRKYSYKLLLVQEIIGSTYYLELMQAEKRDQMMAGLFLEMLGSDGVLKLQKSNSYNPIETTLIEVLDRKNAGVEEPYIYDFRSLIGNDEIVFEAFDIPMASLSRFPYKEYHTSDDAPDIIHPERLNEAVQLLLDTIGRLENSVFVQRKDKGIYALSNPDYDLFVAFGTGNTENARFRKLMDFLFFMDKPHTIYDLATKFELHFAKVDEYIHRCIQKGIITKC